MNMHAAAKWRKPSCVHWDARSTLLNAVCFYGAAFRKTPHRRKNLQTKYYTKLACSLRRFIFGSNGERYVRISLCATEEKLKEALARIQTMKKTELMKDIKPIQFEGVSTKRPIVIAGPCSAETEEQVMETATELAKNGIRIFRAGIWKPRTKPGGFEGIGSVGLEWLRRVKKKRREC